ncbi:hypothetical protein RFI_01108 [Reticulomyxa filosa]|uniref:Uncharacterized protein n=1 Tax=Reticulomyxa filosa TaxID=46433 RepID=X6PBS8_RETFI|nr:hypothetical protein RFI_01108 [Reticulomyxa filosa]|eukprot:ETO35955.1 hypothetical protein RFI_01108 [Reticulomyxa filosa]
MENILCLFFFYPPKFNFVKIHKTQIIPITITQVVFLLFLFFIFFLKQSKEEEIQIIIHRILNIKLGWIKDFDKLVANYVSTFFTLDTFISTSKLLKTFIGHAGVVCSIDYSTLDGDQLICSVSHDKTVRVWDFDNNKQIQSFTEHSNYVFCAKFSPYHYYNYHQNVICSLSFDKTIRLWDAETSKLLHFFNGHEDVVCCVDILSLRSNNNNDGNNKMNNIGIIGGNGYAVCSGSFDNTVRIWDIETTKQFNVFKGHEHWVRSVKYGSNELLNIE